ncbi:hypothetical protein [Burkholderia guangdongensis]|uniref:hypothetical protein n=1 Tax=Burkholderia guangdongensis TaxID=1792500 RepID=UPI0015CB4566|nr:hypothetical protein [Burkholderia guangdongensis]
MTRVIDDMTETKRWWDADGVTFELNASTREASPGTLLIGLGNPNPGAMRAGVSLNQKGFAGPRHASVTAFVHAADETLWAYWRSRFANTAAIRKVVVEDFSLDTCFALLLFGAVLDGRQPDAYGCAAWLDYVSAWERGIYLDGADLERSAACLLSVLGHSYLPEDVTEVATGGFVAQAFRACLALVEQMCAAQANPLGGIDRLNTREYARAIGQLSHERQMYELALKRACQCQLLVDLDGSARRVVLDALFLTETYPSGVLKVMARTDTAHAWTRRGFGMLAIHRPGERGTGNDMVVSVDPATGAQLGAAWRRLEELENQRWGDDRPHGQPRPLQSYRDPAHPDRLLPGAPDEPWYDDGGNFTLIAAPKRVADGAAGTRLDWYDDVVPALWQLGFTDRVQHLVECVPDTRPRASAEARKRITRVHRRGAVDTGGDLHPDRLILETPTFHAWLAAQSMPDPEIRSPFMLPASASFDVQHFGSISAVMHRHGVTFYSRDTDSAHLQHLCELAERVADASSAYDAFLHDYVSKLAGWTDELLEASTKGEADSPGMARRDGNATDAGGAPRHPGKAERTGGRRDPKRWTEEVVQMKAAALAALSDMTMLEADYDRNLLSEQLQRLWGLSEQRVKLLGLIDRVDELMRQVIAARTERRQRVYGACLSAAGLGIAASHILEPFTGLSVPSAYEWQLKLFRETPPASYEQLRQIAEHSAHHETLMAVFVAVFSVLGLVLYWIFGIRGETE